MTGRQLVFELGARAALGRDDLLVTPGNSDAVAWIDRWPDWPGRALAVHGPAGCGKTHLAEVWRALSGAEAVAPAALDEVTARMGSMPAAPAFVVENAEGADERAILHFLNTLRERGGTLLLASRRPPARWPVKLADLSSRLRALPAVAVRAPDEATLRAVVVKLFADRQLQVGADLVEFLCRRIERTFAAARDTVAALDAAALVAQRKVSVALAREVLAREALAREVLAREVLAHDVLGAGRERG